MVWSPNLAPVPQPIPTEKLLGKAVWKLYQKRVITNPLQVMKDQYGVYGFRYPQFLLVAKKETYGNIVSVHEEAILDARKHRIRIVMWLDSAGKFYSFDPEEVDREGSRNYKGHSPMVNFLIKLGKAVEW